MTEKLIGGLTGKELAAIVAKMVEAYEASVAKTGKDPLAEFIKTDGERLGLKRAA